MKYKKDLLYFLTLILFLPSLLTFLYGGYLTRTYEFYDHLKFSVTDLNEIDQSVELKGVLNFFDDFLSLYDRVSSFAKISTNFIRYDVRVQVSSDKINLFIKPKEPKERGEPISAIFSGKVSCYGNFLPVQVSQDWKTVITSAELDSEEIRSFLSNFKCDVQSLIKGEGKVWISGPDSRSYDIQPTLGGGIKIKPDDLSYFFIYLLWVGIEITLAITARELLRISRGRKSYFFESIKRCSCATHERLGHRNPSTNKNGRNRRSDAQDSRTPTY